MPLEVMNMDNWELGINKLVHKNYQSKLIATLRMEQFSDKFHVDTTTLYVLTNNGVFTFGYNRLWVTWK